MIHRARAPNNRHSCVRADRQSEDLDLPSRTQCGGKHRHSVILDSHSCSTEKVINCYTLGAFSCYNPYITIGDE